MQEGTLTFPLFTKLDMPRWYDVAFDLIVLTYIGWSALELGYWGGAFFFALALIILLPQKIVLFRRIKSGVPAVQLTDEVVRLVTHSGEDWKLKWDEIATVEEQWVSSGNPTLLLCKNTGLHFFRIKVNSDPAVYQSLRSALIARLDSETEISLLKQPRLYSLPEFLKGIGRVSSLAGFAFCLFGFGADQLRFTWVGIALMIIGGGLSASPAALGRITLRAS